MTNKQTVLVAGATGNVGGGAAMALARRGVHVVLLGRRPAALEAKAESIRAAMAEDEPEAITASGSDVPAIDILTLDLADMDSVRAAATEALERFPVIDGLVLSVVTLVQGGPNILPSGHELMFATNVMGPFLLTNLLVERLGQSGGLVLDVVAPFYREVDWHDLESIESHKTGVAYNRTKTMNRALAAELARRHGDTISSVAFNPWFVIDKGASRLDERWPKGPSGVFWRVMTRFLASPPSVAGEPIADLMLSADRRALNGALYRLGKRIEKPDRAMNDEALCRRLWDELEKLTAVPTR